MSGLELYNRYTSLRDFSGSPEDEYAQLLKTLFFHLREDLFPLLVKAENLNKKLSIKEEDSEILIDEYTLDDIVTV